MLLFTIYNLKIDAFNTVKKIHEYFVLMLSRHWIDEGCCQMENWASDPQRYYAMPHNLKANKSN